MKYDSLYSISLIKKKSLVSQRNNKMAWRVGEITRRGTAAAQLFSSNHLHNKRGWTRSHRVEGPLFEWFLRWSTKQSHPPRSITTTKKGEVRSSTTSIYASSTTRERGTNNSRRHRRPFVTFLFLLHVRIFAASPPCCAAKSLKPLDLIQFFPPRRMTSHPSAPPDDLNERMALGFIDDDDPHSIRPWGERGGVSLHCLLSAPTNSRWGLNRAVPPPHFPARFTPPTHTAHSSPINRALHVAQHR